MISYGKQYIDKKDIDSVTKVLKSDWITQGPKIKEFENLINQIDKIAMKNQITLRHGVYTWTIGPTYETPAEIEDIERLGGHAVGMSGLPEIERIHKLDMKMIGLCCLTNYASGISGSLLTHKEVVSMAQTYQNHFLKLARYTDRITFILDSDEAGVKSVQRIYSKYISRGIKLRFLKVPDSYKDVDEYFSNPIKNKHTTLVMKTYTIYL